MAITKLVSPSVPNPTVSGAGGSWDLAMAQLTACKKMLSGEQMILTQWTNATVLPALKLGSYLQHAGTIYVVDTADYAITAPTSDGTYYIRLAVSAETLAVSFISSLSGYAWNTQHNGLYDTSGNQVLPYQIVRSGGNYAKRRILNPYHTTGFSTIDYTGNIAGSSLTISGNIAVGGNAIIDGHDIDSELDTLNGRVNQDLKTTANPTFAGLTMDGLTIHGLTIEERLSTHSDGGVYYIIPKSSMAVGESAIRYVRITNASTTEEQSVSIATPTAPTGSKYNAICYNLDSDLVRSQNDYGTSDIIYYNLNQPPNTIVRVLVFLQRVS